MVAGSLLVFGCKKDKETEMDLTSAEDQSSGEMSFDQVFKEVDEAANSIGLKKGGFPVITIDSNISPRVMTIYYGETNYLCLDGNYRRGTITVSWTGKYRQTGTIITIGFLNFYQNDNKVEGSKVITNGGLNNEGKTFFTIVVTGKITNPDGRSHTWNSNRTRTWKAGEGTVNRLDDVYEISGTTSGINRNGLSYIAEITKNLNVELGCIWRITSGTIQLTPEGKAIRTVDFGNGACDRLITITINGKVKTIEKRR